MKAWQVQEAKMNLSDLIRSAKLQPQLITVRGHPEVVVVSTKTYSKLNKIGLSIFNIMQKFPDKNFNLIKKRSRDASVRNIDIN